MMSVSVRSHNSRPLDTIALLTTKLQTWSPATVAAKPGDAQFYYRAAWNADAV